MSTPPSRGRGDALLQRYLERLLEEAPAGTGEALPEVAAAHPQAPADWQAAGFQALLLHLGPLRLGLPLTRLHGMTAWQGPCPTAPGAASGPYGTLRHAGREVRVVITSRLVLEGRSFDAGAGPGQVVLLDGGAWGLDCDAPGSVLRLPPEQVKWRCSAGSRPWLAGTLRAHGCALLALNGLAAAAGIDLA